MTGYASANVSGENLLAIELRGVNSRYLDLIFKMPDELRPLEPALRERLRKALVRGKVECRINWQLDPSARASVPDPDVLAKMQQNLALLAKSIPNLCPPSATDLLNHAGLFSRRIDIEALRADVLVAIDEAIINFTTSRVDEGRRLATVIIERLDAIDVIAKLLVTRAPDILQAYEARLVERLEKVFEAVPGGKELDTAETAARIRQEISVHGLRTDVAEELDRLKTHVQECRARLHDRGPVGKRLDFLMQELNREANTLASKASAVDLSQAAIELKLLIEQIREQVQNLE